MALRIERNSFYSVGERTLHSAAGLARRDGGQSFDQVQFPDRLTGLGGQVQELTARLPQEVRVRPTRQELQNLREQVEKGSYRPDAGEIAARMLLLGEGG